MSAQPNAKIGIDANRPIDPKTGEIQAQVADPEIIAGTGAGWVRLNLVLSPWTSPGDPTIHAGRTWAQTYRHLINGFRGKGLRVYCLIGVEAMAEGPKDRFRAPPPDGVATDDWIERYAQQFATIAELFHHDVTTFESFNEPDDWHGQDRNWVHPGWFAILLQRVYAVARSRPHLSQVQIVSGPLQGLETNRNAAAGYLQQTYRAGKARFGWGEPGVSFPFDAVGYHLYVKPKYEPNRALQARAVRSTCRRYLEAVHQVIRQEEGKDKPVYVSELGWSSTIDYAEVQRQELFQAHCLQIGLATVAGDPLVGLSCWFCTQDFPSPRHDTYYGLYRMGDPAPENRKPAFEAFKAVCEGKCAGEAEARPYKNQWVLTAFGTASTELGYPDRWAMLKRANLSLEYLAANRTGEYEGPPIDLLPNLTDAEKTLIQRKLDAEANKAAASPGPARSMTSDLPSAWLPAGRQPVSGLRAGSNSPPEGVGNRRTTLGWQVQQAKARDSRSEVVLWRAIGIAASAVAVVLALLLLLT